MKQIILVIHGAEAAENSDAATTPAAIRSACAALCGELGIGIEFREAEDHDSISQWLLADAHRAAGVVFDTSGLPDAPASVDMRRAALLKLASLARPAVEVCLENAYRIDSRAAQPLPVAAGHAGFVCGFGIEGFLLAIRSIAGRLHGLQGATGTVS